MSGSLEQNIFQLAELMRVQPEGTDRSILKHADRCLQVLDSLGDEKIDSELREALRELFMMAITDLSKRAPRLRDNSFGLARRDGRLELFSFARNDEADVGQILCRIDVQDAFHENLEIGAVSVQDDINAAIYLLTERISRL